MITTMKKIDILGTQYDFIHDDSLIEQNHDGICKSYTKEIKLRTCQNMLEPDEALSDKRRRYDEVARHELFMHFSMKQVLIVIVTMKNWFSGLQSNFQRC